jgi:hypothetical protein
MVTGLSRRATARKGRSLRRCSSEDQAIGWIAHVVLWVSAVGARWSFAQQADQSAARSLNPSASINTLSL